MKENVTLSNVKGLTEMKEMLEYLKPLSGRIEIQYMDYDLMTWTVPQIITDDIIYNVLNDASIRQIRITTSI